MADQERMAKRRCSRPEAVEHLIVRKQNQVDWLRRARREP